MATEPSPWVERFAGLVPYGGPVLDVACGRGRHTRLFLARGHPVTAVDRDHTVDDGPGGQRARRQRLCAVREDAGPSLARLARSTSYDLRDIS